MVALVVRFDVRHGTKADLGPSGRNDGRQGFAAASQARYSTCGHRVSGEATARIFYELYMDEEAFQAHEVARLLTTSTLDEKP